MEDRARGRGGRVQRAIRSYYAGLGGADLSPHVVGRACAAKLRRTIAGSMLRLLGHEVTVLTCADDALLVLESALPLDLLLTVVPTPGSLGGLELVEAAQRKRPGMALVLPSGWADSELPVVSPRDRHAPFLMKPYSLAELQRALDAATAQALRPYRQPATQYSLCRESWAASVPRPPADFGGT